MLKSYPSDLPPAGLPPSDLRGVVLQGVVRNFMIKPCKLKSLARHGLWVFDKFTLEMVVPTWLKIANILIICYIIYISICFSFFFPWCNSFPGDTWADEMVWLLMACLWEKARPETTRNRFNIIHTVSHVCRLWHNIHIFFWVDLAMWWFLWSWHIYPLVI